MTWDLTIHNGVGETSEMKKHPISTPYKNFYKLTYTIQPQELNQSYNALTLETDKKILKYNDEYLVSNSMGQKLSLHPSLFRPGRAERHGSFQGYSG